MDHTRHSGIFNIPPYFQVGIVGAGGLGATTALSLTKMGVQLMTVWDDDTISELNIPTQLHPVSDVGEYKVNSLQRTLEMFSDEICYTGVHARITPKLQHISQYAFQRTHYNLFITAVDSITARQEIWQQIHEYNAQIDWLLDMRMGAEEYQHFLVPMSGKHPSIHRYAEMLESIKEGDIPDAPCTAKATFYTSMMAAGHAGKVLRDIVRNEALPHRFIHYIADEQIRYFNL